MLSYGRTDGEMEDWQMNEETGMWVRGWMNARMND